MSKFYVKVWLPNIKKYWFREQLSLDEAQRIKDNFEKNRWKAKILKHVGGNENG